MVFLTFVEQPLRIYVFPEIQRWIGGGQILQIYEYDRERLKTAQQPVAEHFLYIPDDSLYWATGRLIQRQADGTHDFNSQSAVKGVRRDDALIGHYVTIRSERSGWGYFALHRSSTLKVTAGTLVGLAPVDGHCTAKKFYAVLGALADRDRLLAGLNKVIEAGQIFDPGAAPPPFATSCPAPQLSPTN
jgi:hypothetical protein